jgi:nucleoside-diphosphate-sugar epimerase
MDVYRAYGGLHAGRATDPVPIDETSAVREERYPYRGQIPGMDDYEKLDVEEVYLSRGATVLRLPMVYGPHDGQRREEFVLRRVRAGRDRIPIGSGAWVGTKGFVADVARGIRLAIESDVTGAIFNLGETRTYPMSLWAQMILDAADSGAELVRVPDDKLPDDLGLTGLVAQHLLVDSSKARRTLGWTDTDPTEALRTSVAWHLANPPDQASEDFDADDNALAAALPATS